MDVEERQIIVFVSSGFKDMEKERNTLLRHVFPKVREYCYERDILFSEIDLRVGVSEADSRNNKTIAICLEEVQRSKPFFLGILGERYGWMPKQWDLSFTCENLENVARRWCEEEWSATAMEMMYAVLDDSLEHSKSNAPYSCFFLREAKLTDDLYGRHKNDMGCSASQEDYYCKDEEEIKKLDKLKELIRSSACKSESYSEIGDVEKGTGFAGRVYHRLVKMIENRYPPDHNISVDKAAIEHNAYSNNRLDGYEADEAFVAKVNNLLQYGDSVIITGPSGIGKSTLLAAIAKESEKTETVVLHHCGVGRETTANEVIKRVTRMLDSERKLGSRILCEPNPVNVLQEAIEALPVDRKVMVIIDAMNQCRPSKVVADDNPAEEVTLGDLISELKLPRYVRFLVSTTSDQLIHGFEHIPMSEPKMDTITKIVRNFNRRYRKLRPKKEEELADRFTGHTPLYVRTLLDEFRMRVRTNFSPLPQDEYADEIMENIAENDSIEKLLKSVLERAEEDIRENGSPDIVFRFRKFLVAVCVLRGRVSGDDIREICDLTPMEFATIRHLLPHLLCWRGENLVLGHEIFNTLIPLVSSYEVYTQNHDPGDWPVIDDILEKSYNWLAEKKQTPRPGDYFAARSIFSELTYYQAGSGYADGLDLEALSSEYRQAAFLNQFSQDELFWLVTQSDPGLGDSLSPYEKNSALVEQVINTAEKNFPYLRKKFDAACDLVNKLGYFREKALHKIQCELADADEFMRQEEIREAGNQSLQNLYRALIEFESLPPSNKRGGLARIKRLSFGPNEAERRNALDICEKNLGSMAVETACSANNLATYLFDQEKYEEADGLFCRALSILNKIGNEKDAQVVSKNLGNNRHYLKGKDLPWIN